LETGADSTVLSAGRKIGKKEKIPAQIAEYIGYTETGEAVLSLFQDYSR